MQVLKESFGGGQGKVSVHCVCDVQFRDGGKYFCLSYRPSLLSECLKAHGRRHTFWRHEIDDEQYRPEYIVLLIDVKSTVVYDFIFIPKRGILKDCVEASYVRRIVLCNSS